MTEIPAQFSRTRFLLCKGGFEERDGGFFQNSNNKNQLHQIEVMNHQIFN